MGFCEGVASAPRADPPCLHAPRRRPAPQEVVERFVTGPTLATGCRYVDSGLVPAHAAGPPTFFVVHRWADRFSLLVEALQAFLEGEEPAEVFVWLDLFAVRPATSSCDLYGFSL